VTEQLLETGLLLPSREALLWADGDMAFLVEAAVEAEKAGYDSVWVGDSLLARPRGEPLTLLAGIAGATERVRLGTAVLLPLLRHPVSLAHVQRIILVGDPNQLPPIGVGRPFADLVGYLETALKSSDAKHMALTSALGRLTVEVRATAGGPSDTLRLASWFTREVPSSAIFGAYSYPNTSTLTGPSQPCQ